VVPTGKSAHGAKEVAVKTVIAAIVAGPLMLIPLLLIGVLPAAAAGPSTSSDTPIRLAAGSDSTADRDSYTQKARDDLQEWQRRLHDFGEKAKTDGQKDAAAAQHDLNEAWAKTQAEARKLQAASAEDWERAKISYEKASQELADAWHRIGSGDK
jgi:hypothetical protein